MTSLESHGFERMGTALRVREAALQLFEKLERAFPADRDAASALEGIGWLYDLLPPDARKRGVDPSGVRSLHECLSVLQANVHQ